MHQMSFGSRALPGPAEGAYSAPSDPLAALKLQDLYSRIFGERHMSDFFNFLAQNCRFWCSLEADTRLDSSEFI